MALAQQVSIKIERATLKEVFYELSQQTGYNFMADASLAKKIKTVSVDLKDAPLKDALKTCFKGLAVDIVTNAQHKTVFVREIPNVKTSAQGNTAISVNDIQQQSVITGKVVGKDGESLAAVSVTVKGTQIQTVSDANGNYRINVPGRDAVLVFSYLGYNAQERRVGNATVLDVQLAQAVSSLDEVVVSVGYGTVRKSDLTGSVSSLKQEDFNQGVTANVQQLMQARVPGVQVVQNDGKPGGGISVNIRGVGSINSGTGPLYVIDGLPSDNLNFINPVDVESLEVLKDASATAIYGARGANGVVLVTTKKGQSGSLRVDYDAYMGVQNVVKKLDVMNAEDYMQVMNYLIDNGGGAESERVIGIEDGGTDWQDGVFSPNATLQNHNVSFAGGSDVTRFYIGLNNFNQEGVVKNTAFQRYSGRVNLEHRIRDKFLVGINLSTSYIKDRNIPSGFSVDLNNSGALYAAYNYDPTISNFMADGQYNQSPFMNLDHPLALVYGKTSALNRYKTFGTMFAEYFIRPELSFRLNLGGDMNSHENDRYVDRTTIEGLANDGIGSFSRISNTNYLIEGLVNYDKQFNHQRLTAVLGATTQRFITTDIGGSGRGFPSDITQTYNFGLADPVLYTLNSSKVSNRLLSYLGRINYTLLDKYLLTASIRADGSSRFGRNNRFGYFPSIAGAWKIEEEDFFQSLRQTVNTLKLRASWGLTGNQEIGNYEAFTTFGNGPVAVFDNTQVKTMQPTRIGNPDLKWETTAQTNIGIDYALFGSRISGSIDYFKKETFDMLLNLPIPTSTGYAVQRRNIGRIVNSGLEFGLSSTNIHTSNFSWNTDFMFNTLKNEVKDLAGVPQIISGSAGFSNQISVIQEGAPLRSFYGYEIIGVWQEGDDFSQTTDNVNPGDFRFRDVDGNGIVNADDRQILGDSFPDFVWSFGNTFSWKNLSLYMFFEGQTGLSMFNGNLAETYFPISLRRNRLAEPLLNRWTPERPSNQYPSFITPMAQGQKGVNSYTVEDASYIRLNTLKITYRFPAKSRLFNALSVYLTGENLITWTNYKGIDPAVNPNSGTDLRIDFNVYPLARTFMGGVNLQF